MQLGTVNTSLARPGVILANEGPQDRVWTLLEAYADAAIIWEVVDFDISDVGRFVLVFRASQVDAVCPLSVELLFTHTTSRPRNMNTQRLLNRIHNIADQDIALCLSCILGLRNRRLLRLLAPQEIFDRFIFRGLAGISRFGIFDPEVDGALRCDNAVKNSSVHRAVDAVLLSNGLLTSLRRSM